MRPVLSDQSAPRESAVQLAEGFEAAVLSSISAGYEFLASRLDDEVLVQHSPAAEGLDGWRSGAETQTYLREEAIAIPRAFESDLRLEIGATASDDTVCIRPWTWVGTLRGTETVKVSIGYEVILNLKAGRISSITGSPLASTQRDHIKLWLRAIESCGGFKPPPPRGSG